jgi:type IV pilus assembly protein PilC
MLFKYQSLDSTNTRRDGSIDAVNVDVAISSLQRRGFTLISIEPVEKSGFLQMDLSLLNGVSGKDLVIISRQISTLFGAQISALRIFRMLEEEVDNPALRKALHEISNDLQSGNAISAAMAKHKKVFSPFYVNMVRAGEETGKLDETFDYLADYLDRTYEVASKARNALIYPAFVVVTFITVMVLMLTLVIPKISAILIESGTDVPIYTKIVVGISQFFVEYGIFLLILIVIGAFFLWRYSRTEGGKYTLSELKLSVPYLGHLYRQLYLSRIADNMSTMLSSGIPMVRALEVTADVVDNEIYEEVLTNAVKEIKSGSSVSDALGKYKEIPGIMSQMIKVGEESGSLGVILSTLAKFYRREVTNAVDSLVNMIEPAMIVALALGVGVLLASVLMPIYNISSAI